MDTRNDPIEFSHEDQLGRATTAKVFAQALLNDPRRAMIVAVFGPWGTATTFTPGIGSGNEIDINGTTSVSDNGVGTFSTWAGSGSGSTFKLDDGGHLYTIVGGTYGTTTKFSNSNSSLNDGHDDPHIQSTGEWVLDFKGGTANANTSMSGVTIYFGTNDETSFSVPPSGAPEPFTLGLGAAGIALAVRRRLRTR